MLSWDYIRIFFVPLALPNSTSIDIHWETDAYRGEDVSLSTNNYS